MQVQGGDQEWFKLGSTDLSHLLLLAPDGRHVEASLPQHPRRLTQRPLVLRHHEKPVLTRDHVKAGGLKGSTSGLELFVVVNILRHECKQLHVQQPGSANCESALKGGD